VPKIHDIPRQQRPPQTLNATLDLAGEVGGVEGRFARFRTIGLQDLFAFLEWTDGSWVIWIWIGFREMDSKKTQYPNFFHWKIDNFLGLFLVYDIRGVKIKFQSKNIWMNAG